MSRNLLLDQLTHSRLPEYQKRPLKEVASEIHRLWKNKTISADMFLQAMRDLESINDKYVVREAVDVVLHFLYHARSWEGEDAKRIKTELTELIAKSRKWGRL